MTYRTYTGEYINDMLVMPDQEKEFAMTRADLMWCLGKLEGLGHPAFHLNDKYNLVVAKRVITKHNPNDEEKE